MDRRTFVKNSSMTAFSVAAFGALQWNGKSVVGDTPTTTDILGPFYRPGAPLRSNIIPAGSTGDPMNLTGTIYQKDGKTPMRDAFIEIWQVNEKGEYDNTSDDFVCRGAMKTGDDGVYHFRTIIPVPYHTGSGYRPAHIHMRISSSDHQDLITQIYFKGDLHLQEDFSSKSPESINRILSISKNAKQENAVQFDIVMRKEFPLDSSVYKKFEGLYQMDDKSMVEFSRVDDLLFAKVNGQIREALSYKGNNEFEGGLGAVKVRFELLTAGKVKSRVTYLHDNNKEVVVEGTKILKY